MPNPIVAASNDDEGSGSASASPAASRARAPAELRRAAPQHLLGQVDAHAAVALIAAQGLDEEVGGAGGEIEDPGGPFQLEQVHARTAPAHVGPRGQKAVQEVVAAGDAVE